MSNEAFRPSGNTVLVAASSSTSIAATQISSAGMTATYLVNTSTAASVWLAIGSSLIAASIPTTTTPSLGMCLSPGGNGVLNTGPAPANNWISAVTSAGATVSVFATPGSGW